MGLSGNTRKTKIPDDPRNTKWANDTSAPGFRLLASMGWTPSAPALGLATSQALIAAGGGNGFSKKVSIIPIAKDDNLGIGARRGAGSTGMRAMGLPMMIGGAAGMGFVTAAVASEDGSASPAPVGGSGEFGRLLDRLNAANSARNSREASADAAVESDEAQGEKKETKEERKARKAEKKELKRKRSTEDDEVAAEVVAAVIAPVVVLDSLETMILKNPRMA